MVESMLPMKDMLWYDIDEPLVLEFTCDELAAR